MKKIFKILIFIMIFLPFTVVAKNDGISNYYIEANVMQNGNLYVKELIVLEGQFNGYERIINFKNNHARKFIGDIQSFEGSDIYNGTDIKIIKIQSIEVDENINFEYLYKKGTEFSKVDYSAIGEHGKYTVKNSDNGIECKIYNPSDYNEKGFYIEYIIENLAVMHNDIAEIGWNIFSQEQNEYIKNLEMIVNIPNNKNELRVWGHGPLNGETKIINKNKMLYKINDLDENRPIDIRFVFDKEILKNHRKETKLNALDLILEVETKRAAEANKIREEARAKIKQKRNISYIFDTVKILYLLGLSRIVYELYNKHDKEYQTTFKTKYYRDFPGYYGPSNVAYLINRKIGVKEMSGMILDLIARKHIKYETLLKSEYQLVYLPDNNVDILTEAEKKIIKMLFNTIGRNNKVTIKQINKYAKKDYNSFLDEYNDWKEMATIEAENKNFFEEKGSIKAKATGYSALGLLTTIVFFEYTNYDMINILVIILSILSIIYFLSISKRTKEGQEQFLKWMGLKRFLQDFGNFEKRELPQIELWEKYLVYATVFGISKKLAKSMEVKFKELANNTYTAGDYLFDIAYIRMIGNLNHSINQGFTNAVNTALSTKTISESSNSSSGGFGGGFSGGGGSFGGGGGGGRF